MGVLSFLSVGRAWFGRSVGWRLVGPCFFCFFVGRCGCRWVAWSVGLSEVVHRPPPALPSCPCPSHPPFRHLRIPSLVPALPSCPRPAHPFCNFGFWVVCRPVGWSVGRVVGRSRVRWLCCVLCVCVGVCGFVCFTTSVSKSCLEVALESLVVFRIFGSCFVGF